MNISQSTVRTIKAKFSLFHCGDHLALGYTMVAAPNPEWITTMEFISHSGYTSAVGGLPRGGFAACISHPEDQVQSFSAVLYIAVYILYVYLRSIYIGAGFAPQESILCQ